MLRNGQVRNPIRVVLAGVHFGVSSGRARRRLIETLSRRRIRRVIARTREAGERRPGEVRAKVFVACPRGANPMGGAGGWWPKNPLTARHFRRARTQKPTLVRPV